MNRELRNISLEQHVPWLIALGFAIIVCPVTGFLAGRTALMWFESKSYFFAISSLGLAVFGLLFPIACWRKYRRTWQSLKEEKFGPPPAPRRNL
jgi:hypothetical protein